MYNPSPIPSHAHNGSDSQRIDVRDINNPGFLGRMYLQNTQSIATSTSTKVALDTISFSPFIKASTSLSRFTIIKGGYYFINGQVTYSSYVAAKNVVADIFVNGNVAVISLGAGFNAGQLACQQVSGLVRLNVNDYVELFTFHNFGAGANLEAQTVYTFLEIFPVNISP